MGAVDALQTSQFPRTRDWNQFYPPRAHMNTTWRGGLQTGAGTLLFPLHIGFNHARHALHVTRAPNLRG